MSTPFLTEEIHEQFCAEFEALIEKYWPLLGEPDSEDGCDHEPDPDSTWVSKGWLVAAVRSNYEGWDRQLIVAPLLQCRYFNMGLSGRLTEWTDR